METPPYSVINIRSTLKNCRPGRLVLSQFGMDSMRCVTMKTLQQYATFKEIFSYTGSKTPQYIPFFSYEFLKVDL